MMRRLFPHPYTSALLVVTWMLLVNRWAIGSLAMALFLGMVIPLATAAYWPARPRLTRPWALIPYVVLVLWDVVLANIQVARIILFMPPDQIRSAWIAVPVDLKSPEAITLLAGTITMTPGTLTGDMTEGGSALLIHALHAPDPEAVRNQIKSRYEARLKTIFE